MTLTDKRTGDFLDACFACGIKRPDLFIISKMPQVYSQLKGSFPRGILPTDVDGEVEINGHFLRLEFKHADALRNGRIPKGQLRAFTALLATGKFTVLLIGTDDDGIPSCAQIWYPTGKKVVRASCDWNWVRAICARWAEYAEGKIK